MSLAGAVLVLVVVMGFASLNGGERVTLRLGFTTFYRVPLTVVAFGSLFLGMVVMLVAGLHSDLRVRKILRERLREEAREEQDRVDRLQRDLFQQEEDGEVQQRVGREPEGRPDSVAAPIPPARPEPRPGDEGVEDPRRDVLEQPPLPPGENPTWTLPEELPVGGERGSLDEGDPPSG